MKNQSSKSAKVMARYVFPRPAGVASIFLLLALAFNFSAMASTLTLSFTNQLGQPDTNIIKTIALDNNTPVLANGTVLTKGLPVKWTPDSNGVVHFYLTTGNYLLTNAFLGSGIVYCFPDSTTNATAYPKSGFNTFYTSVQVINTNGVTPEQQAVIALAVTNQQSTLTLGTEETTPNGAYWLANFFGKFVGDGSGLYNLAPTNQVDFSRLPQQVSTNGSLLSRLYYGKPGIYTALDAAAATGSNTNGQSPSTWTDLFGLNPFRLSNVKFSDSQNGFPAFMFNQSTSVASNIGYFASVPSMNTNVTMFFVYKSLVNGSNFNNSMALTCGTNGSIASFWVNGNSTGRGGAPQITIKTNGQSVYAVTEGKFETQILGFRYNGTYLDSYLNGCPTTLGRVGDTTFGINSQAGGIGLWGNAYIGNFANLQNPPAIAITKILIYTNCLSYSDMREVSMELCKEYNVSATIILGGDSIAGGFSATAGNSPEATLGRLLPQDQIVTTAGSGINSYQIMTNMIGQGGWLSTLKWSDAAIYIPYSVNDSIAAYGFTVANTETNMLIMRDYCRSNGIIMGIHKLASGYLIDTNGYRAAFNSWVDANAASFDFVIDPTASPIGTNNACYNTNYYATDALHLNGNGYEVLAAIRAAAIQKYRASKTIGTVLYGDGSNITNILESSFVVDFCLDANGSATKVASPFMLTGFLNRFYNADVVNAPFTMGRLTPAVLLTGKTNLVSEIWMICTNAPSSLSTFITVSAATNNPAGGVGGMFTPLSNVNVVFSGLPSSATNWFRLAVTNAIPIWVWTNLNGGNARYSIYNASPTNCWAGSVKFSVQ